MKSSFLIHIFCSLCFAITTTLAISLSKPGCPEKCGNVTIPYPFGVGSECSANSSFTIICQNFTSPPTIFLSSITMEVLNISLFGTVTVNQPVSPVNCSIEQRIGPVLSFNGSPFTISAHYNSLVVLGCKNSVWLRANKTTTVGGCSASCDANSPDTTCNGVNCCQTTIPTRLHDLQYIYQSTEAKNNSFCGYVFPVDNKWLEKDDYKSYKGLLRDLSNPFDREFGFTPLVLEWELSVPRYFARVECKRYDYDTKLYSNYAALVYPWRSRIQVYDYRCQSLLHSIEHGLRNLVYYSAYDYVSSAGYCECSRGYEGNPYFNEGCTDFNECSYSSLCPDGWTCINRPGGFNCENPGNDHRIRGKIIRAAIIIGSVRGGIIVVIIMMGAAWKFSRVITGFIKAMRRHMFYKRRRLIVGTTLVSNRKWPGENQVVYFP